MTDTMNELRDLVMRAENEWTATGIPRVKMVRAEACSDQVYEPMLHLVLQGTKNLSIGNQVLWFEPASYTLIPIDVPAIGQIHSDAPNRPFLAVGLTLDPVVIATMFGDLCDTRPTLREPDFSATAASPEMMDAWLRMMRLVDRPDEAGILAPMIEREILFRVFQGPHGNMLRQIAHADSGLSQVRRAIDWIRVHFTEPFLVEDLAALAGMSVAALYRHFKAVTAMTPIQYQKKLRLLKARRQLIFEPDAAAAVAFSVGYESASQFSREYARMFGMPPARDVARFKTPIV